MVRMVTHQSGIKEESDEVSAHLKWHWKRMIVTVISDWDFIIMVLIIMITKDGND